MKKYTYYKVIQQNWGYGWDDVDFYETDSTYSFNTQEERKLFKENLHLYKTEQNVPVRVIHRKEKVETTIFGLFANGALLDTFSSVLTADASKESMKNIHPKWNFVIRELKESELF